MCVKWLSGKKILLSQIGAKVKTKVIDSIRTAARDFVQPPTDEGPLGMPFIIPYVGQRMSLPISIKRYYGLYPEGEYECQKCSTKFEHNGGIAVCPGCETDLHVKLTGKPDNPVWLLFSVRPVVYNGSAADLKDYVRRIMGEK